MYHSICPIHTPTKKASNQYKVLSLPPGFLPKLQGNTILLKKLVTSNTEFEGMEKELTWNPLS